MSHGRKQRNTHWKSGREHELISEQSELSAHDDTLHTMSSSQSAAELTLVIPVYNEALRLDACLRTVLAFFEESEQSAELIVVDDGSTDDSFTIASSFAERDHRIHVLAIPHGGKARAVRAGLLAGQGDIVAFSDVDLATPLRYLGDLQQALHGGAEVAIASREGIGSHRIGEPFYRHLMGRGFNVFVRTLLLPGIQDTQCGFKAFQRPALVSILAQTVLYTDNAEPVSGPRVTAFDVELLFVARQLGFQIAIIPVIWSAGENSKVNPITDTWHNLADVLRVRLNAWRGIYGTRRTKT